MKRLGIAILIVTLALVSASTTSYAQKKNKQPVYETPNVPVDETSKKIKYTEVVNSEGTSADLYKKALRWFNTYYRNPTNVIKEKSEADGKILGKARVKFMNPPDKKGLETMAGILQYTIIFYAKDGRYKYELTDFNVKAMSYTPAESWLDKEAQAYTNKNDYYLIQLDNYAKETVKSLNEYLAKQVAKKEEDW